MSEATRDGFDQVFDFISVGSGAGGLTAAIVAGKLGQSALVLEKSSRFGGVTALSAGQLWAGATSYASAVGIDDSVEGARKYLDFLSAGVADEARQLVLVTRADEALRFLDEAADLHWVVVRGWPDYWYPQQPNALAEGRCLEVQPFPLADMGELTARLVDAANMPLGSLSATDVVESGGDPSKLAASAAGHVERGDLCAGGALAGRLLLAAAASGAVLKESSPARSLIYADGRVVGVVAETPDGRKRYGARNGVVLATGGYDRNVDMVRAFEPFLELASVSPAGIEGDHITMATEVGAMVASARHEATPFQMGYHVPGDLLDGLPKYIFEAKGKPHSIYVNREGQRFADESFYPDLNAALARYDGATQSHPNRPVWMIFDSTHRSHYPLGPIAPGESLPDGFGATADTLAQLAEKIGVNAHGLQLTVERFNQFCLTGIDEDFHRGQFAWSHLRAADVNVRPNPLLGPLEAAPYFAIELVQLGQSVVTVGLKVDVNAQVQTARGQGIPGLYAAGNSAARTDVTGYQSGIANTEGILLGYLAVLHAAGKSANTPAV